MPKIDRVDSPQAVNDVLTSFAEHIAFTRDDTVELIVGSENSPTGLRKLIVSRPHVLALSKQFADVVDRRISYGLLGKRTIRQILMPEDDADMIRLIMLVAHLDSIKLPPALDLRELVRLAQTAERYNVSRILMPYLEAWLAPHRSRVTELGYEQWLVVAYFFSLEEDYVMLADYFVVNCQIDAAGNLLHPASNHPLIMTEQFPLSCLETIKRRRLRTIVRLLRITYHMLDEMRESNHCQLLDVSGRSQTQCTALKKLRLERYLTKHKIMPQILDASVMLISPMDLMDILLNSTAAEVETPSSISQPDSLDCSTFLQYDILHENCEVGTELKERLERVLDDQSRDKLGEGL